MISQEAIQLDKLLDRLEEAIENGDKELILRYLEKCWLHIITTTNITLTDRIKRIQEAMKER